MKVLSRSRWPLPPKVRTEEGGSNDPPSRGGHVDVLWVWVCQVWGVAWLELPTKGRNRQTAGRQDGHQAAAVSDGSRPNWPVTSHQGSLPPSLRSLLGGHSTRVAAAWKPRKSDSTPSHWPIELKELGFFLIFIVLQALINAPMHVDSENLWMGSSALLKKVRNPSKKWAIYSKNRYLDTRFCYVHHRLTI